MRQFIKLINEAQKTKDYTKLIHNMTKSGNLVFILKSKILISYPRVYIVLAANESIPFVLKINEVLLVKQSKAFEQRCHDIKEKVLKVWKYDADKELYENG